VSLRKGAVFFWSFGWEHFYEERSAGCGWEANNAERKGKKSLPPGDSFRYLTLQSKIKKII
jgi:hypothetical protein